MSVCPSQGQIDDYLSSDSATANAADVEVHLQCCPACRQKVQAQREESQLFSEIRQAYRAESAQARTWSRNGGAGGRHTRLSSQVRAAIDGYEIESELYRGGQGIIFKARKTDGDKPVAIKVLPEGPYASARQRWRFQREFELVARLDHPNIVRVLDSGVTSDGRQFFAMDYVDGPTLDAYLSDRKLPVRRKLQLFTRICAAIHYAHQRGVIHRDLKPGNICIDETGEPRVLDFGLAKTTGPDWAAPNATVTVSGEFMGTLAYASPEQARGDPDQIDVRSDVYSLGVILYEMLTGNFPYSVVGQVADVLRNIAEAEPKRISTSRTGIDDEVETVIMTALSKEKDRRYPSAEALLRDIERYLAGEPIEAKRDSTWYVLRKALRRHRIAAAVATSFVVLITVSLVIALAQNRVVTAERDRALIAERRADTQADLAQAAAAEATHESQRAGLVEGFIRQMILTAQPSRLGHDVKVLEMLNDAAGRVDLTLGAQPLAAAAVHRAIGETYLSLGRNADAELHLRRALKTFRADTGVSRKELSDCLYMLGRALSLQDDPQGVPLHRESLAIRTEIYGPEHIEVANSMARLGYALCFAADPPRWKEGFKRYRESLAMYAQVAAPAHREWARALHAFGSVLRARGEHPRALKRFQEALDMYEQLGEEEDSYYVECMNDMAYYLRDRNRPAEAEVLLRRVIQSMPRVFGEDRVPMTMCRLAELRSIQGDIQQAESFYRESLRRSCGLYAQEHPEKATEMDRVIALLTPERLDRTPQLPYERVLLELTKFCEDGGVRWLSHFHELANLTHNAGKLDEAERIVRTCATVAQANLETGHWKIGWAKSRVGCCLTSQKKFDEAKRFLIAGHRNLRRSLGDYSSYTKRTASRIAQMYEATGQPRKADVYRELSRRVPPARRAQ